MTNVKFEHIGMVGRSVGSLALGSDLIIWSDRPGIELAKINASEIVRAIWVVFGRYGHLRLLRKNGQWYRFEGFKCTDREALASSLMGKYEIELEDEEMQTGGGNFGDIEFEGDNLVFNYDSKNVFDVNLSSVSQCVLPGTSKNEIEIQFHESDKVDRDVDSLVQIRLYIPPQDNESKAEEFQQAIMERSNIRSVTGDVIVEFDAKMGQFLTPRGRYSIEMYTSFFRMHGQKYDYKIKYDDINRMFHLQMPNDQNIAFIISLEKPIRQGQQRYKHLVMQTVAEDTEIVLNLSEEELQKKYGNELKSVMQGPLSTLMAKVFKTISGKKVYRPGNFKSTQKKHSVRCAYKANNGFLYPLEKSFIFIHKPTIVCRFELIDSIEFQRLGSQSSVTKNFDLLIRLKETGDEMSKEYLFSSIDNTEYQNLFEFLSSKQLSITTDASEKVALMNEMMILDSQNENGKNIGGDNKISNLANADEDEEDDNDYRPPSEDDDEDDDGGDDEDDEGEDDEEDEEDEDDEDVEGQDQSEKKVPKIKDKSKSSKSSSSETGKTKKRKKRDPKAPKRARNAYSYFYGKFIKEMREKHSDMPLKEIAKMASAHWKDASEEERQKYQTLSEQDKKRYQKEMENYQPPPSESKDDDMSNKQPKKKRRTKKDQNAPKKQKTAFNIFCQTMRPKVKSEHPDYNTSQISSELGKMWKVVDSAERQEYEEKAKADKKRYEKEMNLYMQKKAAEALDGDDDDDDDDDDDQGDDDQGDDDDNDS